MSHKASSRERLLAAIDGAKVAPLPCCFMIFRALRRQCCDEVEFALRQREFGVDARVQIEDLPMRFSSQVSLREWTDLGPDGRSMLHREYQTPAGVLRASATKTTDWPYGDRLPIFDDFFTPRAAEYPITGQSHLAALRYLLPEPAAEDVSRFREQAEARRRFARDEGMLLSAGWKSQRFVGDEDKGLIGDNGGTGTVIDALMWLCGATEPLLWAYDNPDFLAELISVVEQWNLKRLAIHLDVGVDIVMRRAWYEGTEFWSPHLFKRFILPGLKQEVAMTHQAGIRYGYIITSGMLPIIDHLLAASVDVIIGIDPGEGKGTTLQEVRDCCGGRVGLWGGISGPLVIEKGTEEEVRRATEEAIELLGPTGRFILSPADNIRDDSEQTWRNVKVFIRTWKGMTGV